MSPCDRSLASRKARNLIPISMMPPYGECTIYSPTEVKNAPLLKYRAARLFAATGRYVMATLFFSYSHADENLRDQLETHLAALKRQSVISSWHDRRITAGTNLGDSIDRHIDSADV